MPLLVHKGSMWRWRNHQWQQLAESATGSRRAFQSRHPPHRCEDEHRSMPASENDEKCKGKQGRMLFWAWLGTQHMRRGEPQHEVQKDPRDKDPNCRIAPFSHRSQILTLSCNST